MRYALHDSMKSILKFSLISMLLHTLISQAAVTVTNIAQESGSEHSLFLKSDGSLWAMGDNGRGQLGDGTFSNTNRPEQIVASGVMTIAAGVYHSLFLKSDGSLWAMGDNSYGNFGDGFIENNFPRGPATPEQIVPSPQPFLSNNISSKTNLQFNATCQFGGAFCLLTSTNLAQSLSQWKPVQTNSVTSRGTNNFSVTLTNALSFRAAQQFYILQSQ
jgi:Regulator of chromosome condensation (RCC1) repeat